jgi:hypothetical protein
VVRREAYALGERERHTLRILPTGEGEIAKGKGRDLRAVMAQADRIPECRELSYSEGIVNPNRFFCRVEGTTVWVVALNFQSVRRPEELSRYVETNHDQDPFGH